jgi:hypothetical protein
MKTAKNASKHHNVIMKEKRKDFLQMSKRSGHYFDVLNPHAGADKFSFLFNKFSIHLINS